SIFTLSLHDALPICISHVWRSALRSLRCACCDVLDLWVFTPIFIHALLSALGLCHSWHPWTHRVFYPHGFVALYHHHVCPGVFQDRKSTRLNSSHVS